MALNMNLNTCNALVMRLTKAKADSAAARSLQAYGGVGSLTKAGSVLVGHRIFVFGGEVSGGIKRKAVFMYDMNAWEWTRPCFFTQFVFEDRLVALVNDQVFFFVQRPVNPLRLEFEGITAARTHVFDLTSLTVEPRFSLGENVLPFEKSAGEYVEALGKIVTFGGKAGVRGMQLTETNRVCAYSVEANSWSIMPTRGRSPPPRSQHCSCMHGKADIFFYGGGVPGPGFASMYKLKCKPGSCTWSSVRWSPPVGYNWASMCCSGSRLFIYGGYGYGRDIFDAKKYLFVYDFKENAGVQIFGPGQPKRDEDLRLQVVAGDKMWRDCCHTAVISHKSLVILGGSFTDPTRIREIRPGWRYQKPKG